MYSTTVYIKQLASHYFQLCARQPPTVKYPITMYFSRFINWRKCKCYIKAIY